MKPALHIGLLSVAAFMSACSRSDSPGLQAKPRPAAPASAAIAAKDCHADIEIKPAGPWQIRRGDSRAVPITVSIKNKGAAKWGGDGLNMQLGAVWFDGGKTDSSHTPNLGEERWGLPGPLEPGETMTFEVTAVVPEAAGQYSAWFSMLQPGVMWCFHVGDPPAKIAASVRAEAKTP
jgi:hypothetical protein